jgi:hypothetical protein
MGIFGNLLGKKKDKIEIQADDLNPDEKMLLASWLRDKREQGKHKLVEVDG